jgi:hypothetical protein
MADIFAEVKNRVTYEELNNIMGWRSTLRGNKLWIHSPLNPNDKTPSLCEYLSGGWKCFSTGYGGSDVTSLYAKVKNIKQIEAARELAVLFHISRDERQQYKPQAFNKNDFFKGLREWTRQSYIQLCDWLHAVDNTLQFYEGEDDVLPVLFELHELLDRWTETLKSDNFNDILSIYKEFRTRGWNRLGIQ